jgi:hypothetical protein
MSFYIGQKVVCVDDKPTRFGRLLTKGATYTIRTFLPRIEYFEVDDGVHLVEIHLPLHELWQTECGFFASRFRPLDERKTDIAVFTKILDGVRSKEIALSE